MGLLCQVQATFVTKPYLATLGKRDTCTLDSLVSNGRPVTSYSLPHETSSILVGD